MFLGSAKSCKNFHHVINFFLFLGSGFVEPILLFKVEELSTYNKLLAPDSLRELMVVDVDESELHFLFLLTIVVIELHLGQQQFGIVVVLNFKVPPFRHVTNNFSWV
jgi:hypothetical protein